MNQTSVGSKKPTLTNIHWITLMACLTLNAAGCHEQHAKRKQQAIDDWNNARTKLIVQMAEQQFQAGQYDKSLNTLNDAFEIDTEYLPAQLLAGRIYLEQNQISQAQHHFQKCLAQIPEHAQANYYLGYICEKRNQLDQAEAHYRMAWKNQPEHSPYLLALVEVLAARNQTHQALQLLEEYLRTGYAAQDQTSVYLAAGNLYLSANQPDKAVSMFRQAAQLAQENLMVQQTLAFALLQTGKPQEALTCLKRIVRETEKQGQELHWSIQLALGDAYLQMKQFSLAQRWYLLVQQQKSDDVQIWTRLAQTALARGDLLQADQWARQGLSINPNDPDALTILEWSALKQKP